MAVPNPLATGLPSVTPVTVIQDTAPSFNWTGATGAVNLWGCTIPGGTVGPNDVIEVGIIWTCNNSAGVKTLTVNLTGTTMITDARASAFGTLQTWFITPSLHRTVDQNIFNVPYPGPISAAEGTAALPMSLDMFIGIQGNLAVTTDNMQVQFVSIRVWQDRTPVPFLYKGQGKKLFYGSNGHFDEMQTPAQFIQSMNTLGCTLARFTWEGSQLSLNNLVALAQAFQSTALTMYCCIDLDLTNNTGTNLLPNENAAYMYGFSAGFQCAAALIPVGVTLFECGNELDTKNNINPGGAAGQFPGDFAGTLNGQSVWPILRGAMRGAIDGVHAAGTAAGVTAYAGSNAFTVCGTAAMQMLWYGWQPDGTGGHPLCQWDFSAFHNYRVYGSLLANPGDTSSGSTVNVLELLWRNFNVPIFISEFNGNSGDTDAQRAAYVAQEFPRFLNHRLQFGLVGVMVYSQFADAPLNFMSSPTTPVSTLGTTYQAFIAANPDPGT